MATSQQQLVCDSSTLANFKQWAMAISGAFSTFGWVQSSDTGQVNWSSIASVPGSGAFVYEVWKPNDGLTNFYVKIEYGNVSGTNCPSLRLTLATATDGAGNPTGYTTNTYNTNYSSYTPPSTTTQFECNFSGAAGRIGVMMWRNGANNCQQFFAIERSVNSSGSYTNAHVTLLVAGLATGGFNVNVPCVQQSLVFGVGASVAIPNASRIQTLTPYASGWVLRMPYWGQSISAFNGTIPVDTVCPLVGYFDYPLTCAGGAFGSDVTEGVPFTVTIYGALRTYMPSKNGQLMYCSGSGVSAVLLMRYD